eukprot:2457625-Amphidinium_carterae.2
MQRLTDLPSKYSSTQHLYKANVQPPKDQKLRCLEPFADPEVTTKMRATMLWRSIQWTCYHKVWWMGSPTMSIPRFKRVTQMRKKSRLLLE